MDEIKLSIDSKSLVGLHIASQSLEKFINHLKTLDPELEQFEAALMASSFLDHLPTIIQSNQNLLSEIQKQCEYIKQQRSRTKRL